MKCKESVFNKLPSWSLSEEGRHLNKRYVLAIIRGLPGSGKTTLAEKMCRVFSTSKVEVDDFMCLKYGTYRKPSRDDLIEAHEWCKQTTYFNLSTSRMSILSNTSCTLTSLLPYFKIAREHGTRTLVVIATPQTDWKLDIVELGKKNLHKVSLKKITSMKKEIFQINDGIYYAKSLWNLNL